MSQYTHDAWFKLTRLERDLEGNWQISWTADPETFEAMRALVKMLDWKQRRYVDAEHYWLITPRGMALLMGVCPSAFAAVIREAIEQGGVHKQGQQRYWHQQQHEQQQVPPRHVTRGGRCKTCAAFQALHLLPTAPETHVKAIYRLLAKQQHPDTGGSHADMQALNEAYERATKREHDAGCEVAWWMEAM